MINTAKWVASLMAQDGITPEMLKDEEFMEEALGAYLEEIGRKIERIQATYMTKPAAREALRQKVLSDLA